MTIGWSKVPTYEEVLKTVDKDFKVKLPDRTALSFYDSFAMGQFREMQQQIANSQQATDAGRDHAMTQAADEEGTSRAAILRHAEQMNAQNTTALGEAQRLNASMQRTHEESRNRQAEEMARLIGQQQVERDNRDRMIERLNAELRSHQHVAPTPVPAPAPDNSAAIIAAVRETANAVRGQASADASMLYQGMAHTAGELVRNMQQSHQQGLSELINNLSRGLPSVNNMFQSDNRHIINITPAPGGPSAAEPSGPSAAAIEDAPKRPKTKFEPPKNAVQKGGKRALEQRKDRLTDKSITERRKQLEQQRRLNIETQAAAASGSTFRVINADAASAADKGRRRGRSRGRSREAYERAPTPEYPQDMSGFTGRRPTLPLR